MKKKKKSRTGKQIPSATTLHSIDFLERIGEKKFNYLVISLFIFLAIVFFANFIFSNKMFYGTDTIPSEYMKRTIYAQYVKSHHSIPRWNPYILGGLPFIDAMHGDIFYPTTILKFFLPVHRALGWKLIIHVILAGIFMFFLLRRLKFHPYAALIAVSYTHLTLPTN